MLQTTDISTVHFRILEVMDNGAQHLTIHRYETREEAESAGVEMLRNIDLTKSHVNWILCRILRWGHRRTAHRHPERPRTQG